MTNVTISGNAAFYIGGLSQTGSAVGTLINCTIVNNTADLFGGGIRVYSTVDLANTLLANNDHDNCSIGSSGSLNSSGHNLEDGNSCNLSATGDITGTDPLVGSLSDLGPSVGAPSSQERMSLHGFSRYSPAIDNGDDMVSPPTDQRGVARPVDGDGDSTATCDIGAFEFDLLNAVFLPLTFRVY